MARDAKTARDGLVRIGVAIETGLLRRFDSWLGARGGGNRSEAFRDLIRDRLISAEIDQHSDVVASVSLVYDHHHRELNRRLTDLQHDHGAMVVSTLHVHIEHDRCLEVVVLRGRASRVRAFADRLIGEKGVVHGGVFMTRRLEQGAGQDPCGHEHGRIRARRRSAT
jgi:CopG family nickel-responsive transcriptional regulator